jgi:hypothetical protein
MLEIHMILEVNHREMLMELGLCVCVCVICMCTYYVYVVCKIKRESRWL